MFNNETFFRETRDILRAMSRPFAVWVLFFTVIASPVLGQPSTSFKSSPTGAAATTISPEAEEVLAFERLMEAAVVRGDVSYVDKVSSPDLTFTHGDAWTTGGKPLLVDDRKSFLQRVQNKQYNARDLDSVKVEMHGDIAIAYGRYVAQNRTAKPEQLLVLGLGSNACMRSATVIGYMYRTEQSTDPLMGRIANQ